jgi:hypothetical protein
MPATSRMQTRLARGEVALCMATRLARTPDIAGSDTQYMMKAARAEVAALRKAAG